MKTISTEKNFFTALKKDCLILFSTDSEFCKDVESNFKYFVDEYPALFNHISVFKFLVTEDNVSFVEVSKVPQFRLYIKELEVDSFTGSFTNTEFYNFLKPILLKG